MNGFFHAIHKFFSGSDPIDQADAVVSKTIGLMQDAEALFPAAGSGASKLEHVRQGLATAWGDFKAIAVDFEQAWVVIGPLIAALVSFYKTTGAFHRSAAP